MIASSMSSQRSTRSSANCHNPRDLARDIGPADQRRAHLVTSRVATERDATSYSDEVAALRATQASDSFQTQVEAFRAMLISDAFQLQKEASLPAKTKLGRQLALTRIEKRVNGFKSARQLEVYNEQLLKEAGKSQNSPRVYKSSVALHALTEDVPIQRPSLVSDVKQMIPEPVSRMEQFMERIDYRPLVTMSDVECIYLAPDGG
ncbi:hypothetical protein J1614_000414 [Plenodomus biglobosus]|nr:hypothetical protein J1614_000414 [Plenodomus biglobosus]